MSLRNEKMQRIRSLLMECAGWEGDEIASDRERAINYYFQRPRGDETTGRSDVVDGSLSSMTEANLAQMLDSFTSDSIAEYPAESEGDDDQAALESATVVQMVMRDNNGYQEIGSAVKDGLLLRNGICKIWVETDEHTETLELINASEEALAELMNQQAFDDIEVLSFDPDTRDLQLRVTTKLRQFRCEAIAIENFLYLKHWHKLDLQRIPFCAERHVEARSELLRRGFPKKKVMQLKAHTTNFKIDSTARDVRRYTPSKSSIDKMAEDVEWFECYVLVDAGKGRVERRRISVAGVNRDSELEDVPVSHVPFAAGSPFINPHRFTGVSLYDKLRVIQDKNTGLERALLDNVNTSIRNGKAYLDGAVNAEDLADGRPAKDIRVRRSVPDVRQAIMSFDQPDLSTGILKNLDYQRQLRTEMGGASLELASGQMQMAGGRIGSEGVDRAFSVMEQLASHMTKNMATTLIRNIFLLAHMVIRENYDVPVDVYAQGRWQTPVPAGWRPRKRVTVKVGMSPGERARKVAALEKVLDSQMALAGEHKMEGVLVDAGQFYKTLIDWARANELEVPEQYYLDPMSESSQAALQAKAESAQAESEAQKALMGQALGFEQLRISLEKYKTDTENAIKVWAETLHAEIEEAKIVGKATADLINQTRFKAGDKPDGNAKENTNEGEGNINGSGVRGSTGGSGEPSVSGNGSGEGSGA